MRVTKQRIIDGLRQDLAAAQSLHARMVILLAEAHDTIDRLQGSASMAGIRRLIASEGPEIRQRLQVEQRKREIRSRTAATLANLTAASSAYDEQWYGAPGAMPAIINSNKGEIPTHLL